MKLILLQVKKVIIISLLKRLKLIIKVIIIPHKYNDKEKYHNINKYSGIINK